MIKAGSIVIKVSKIAECKEEMRAPILNANETKISPDDLASILKKMRIEVLIMNQMCVTTSGITREETAEFYMAIPIRDWRDEE